MIDLETRARREAQRADFDVEFSDDEQRELAALDENHLIASSTRDGSVRDLRELLWSSIDNETSRDLDQVEVVQKLADNSIEVQIGIADVSAFIARDSPLDVQAARNTTSLYTGVQTFPMLPRVLSEDATSLLANRDRLAVVVCYRVQPDGALTDTRFFRAVVRNRAKLIYEEIGAWLRDTSSTRIAELESIGGLREQITLQHEAAQRLQRARTASGALELQTREATPVMKDGRVIDLRETEKNDARKIIENFMVAANMATAQWLQERGRSALGRVVREPQRWPRIREIAQNVGDTLPIEADARALSAFMERQRKSAPDAFAELSLAIVKLLGPGQYELIRPNDTSEHFGLAAARYTHSTAPNRRFSDLVMQRIVKAALEDEAAPYSDAELQTIATRCNEQESRVQKVERTMRKVAAASLFGDRIGQTFASVVTGASAKGVWVRTVSPLVEGRVVRGESGLDVGDRVLVRLIHTDIERGFIDFERA